MKNKNMHASIQKDFISKIAQDSSNITRNHYSPDFLPSSFFAPPVIKSPTCNKPYIAKQQSTLASAGENISNSFFNKEEKTFPRENCHQNYDTQVSEQFNQLTISKK